MSGLRRDQSPLRADTPVIEAQLLPSGNEVMKIHPLASWTREDVNAYIEMHSIPTVSAAFEASSAIACQENTTVAPESSR